MNTSESLPELKIDRTKVKVLVDFGDSDEIEFWKNTSYEERLEYAYRLRYMAYGDKINKRMVRVLEVEHLDS